MTGAPYSIPTIEDLTRPDGTFALDALLEMLHLTKTDLALVLGVPRLEHDQRLLHDFAEILVRVAPWAGSMPQAFAWYSAQPLPSFGDQTAADLLREGRAEAVKAYVSRLSVGGYA